jgi:hypothetical protein
MRAELERTKLVSGCVDCGYKKNANGLLFDHIDPLTKLFDVSQYSSKSVREVRGELAKCAVRCGTCHLIRSAEQNRARNSAKAIVAAPLPVTSTGITPDP